MLEAASSNHSLPRQWSHQQLWGQEDFLGDKLNRAEEAHNLGGNSRTAPKGLAGTLGVLLRAGFSLPVYGRASQPPVFPLSACVEQAEIKEKQSLS